MKNNPSKEPNLFDQPEPTPPAVLEPGAAAVLDGEQRARARDLRRRNSRLGSPKSIRTIEERFEEFHAANPHVFDALVATAREAKKKGYSHWSINGAYEVVRYNSKDTESRDRFKLNDHYCSRYSRLIMATVPDLAGFFSVRSIQRI
jgi:hypothetical protein